ncbi:rhamnogalacturonan acetylesterase [Asticcacaulis solisilvae]|uniref:rhamnogalacturonan acetylesterase n=1 Tax=Asticcacaulis solisilvae TaxID=1217274 RepID=UPI003FD76BCC
MTSLAILTAGGVSAATLPATFTFGAAKAVPGAIVADRSAYDAARGYGFTSLPGGNEQAFSIHAAPGDYEVTVTLGGAQASRTAVWAEDRRLMAAPVALKAGETRTLTFVVNVRDAVLATADQDFDTPPHVGLRGDDGQGRTWDDKLTLSFSGSAPAIQTIAVKPVTARRILIAGDSTVTDQAGGDYASWGQMLPRFVDPALSVANHARSGETMKSFLGSLRWDKLMSETRPGDVVLIQFGHNDEKKQWPRTYAAADGAYPAFLSALVADVRQHGASPVLVTPVARRSFKDGRIENTHAGYDAAVRDVGAKLNVPVIDLTAKTAALYEALGPDTSALAFANDGKDKTHHNAYGAYAIACFVAHDLAVLPGLAIKTALDAPACTPDHPDDPRHYAIEPGDWPIMRAKPVQGAEVKPVK